MPFLDAVLPPRGNYADLPQPGIPGRFYSVADGVNAGTVYRDTGTAWEVWLAPGLTQAAADGRYYTKEQSDAAFLTMGEGDAAFLTQAEGDARYMTGAAANDAFLTQAEGDARYQPIGQAQGGNLVQVWKPGAVKPLVNDFLPLAVGGYTGQNGATFTQNSSGILLVTGGNDVANQPQQAGISTALQAGLSAFTLTAGFEGDFPAAGWIVAICVINQTGQRVEYTYSSQRVHSIDVYNANGSPVVTGVSSGAESGNTTPQTHLNKCLRLVVNGQNFSAYHGPAPDALTKAPDSTAGTQISAANWAGPTRVGVRVYFGGLAAGYKLPILLGHFAVGA